MPSIPRIDEEYQRQLAEYLSRGVGGTNTSTAPVSTATGANTTAFASAFGSRLHPPRSFTQILREDAASTEPNPYPTIPDTGQDFIQWALGKKPELAFSLNVNPMFTQKKGFQKAADESIVGIEVEQESTTEFSVPSPSGWTVHSEGSLRGYGFEHVLSPPLPYKSSLTKTDELFAKLKEYRDYKPTSSIRTSIHVHFDVTKYSLNQLFVFAGVYWALEEFLSEFAGESRKGNLFCIRLKDSLYFSKVLESAFRKPNNMKQMLVQESLRYSSLNFASLSKFGSLEFRLMRGTADPEEVKLWVTALEEIRSYALKFASLKDFIEEFYLRIPAEELTARVFSTQTLEALQKHCKNTSITEGIRYVLCELKGICASLPEEDKNFAETLAGLRKEYDEVVRIAEERSRQINRRGYYANVNFANLPAEFDTQNEEGTYDSNSVVNAGTY